MTYLVCDAGHIFRVFGVLRHNDDWSTCQVCKGRLCLSPAVTELCKRIDRLEGRALCVRHNEGWCVLEEQVKPSEGAPAVAVRCNNVVVLPLGYEFREPTCDECKEALSVKTKSDPRPCL
jgi:hypothetical protein